MQNLEIRVHHKPGQRCWQFSVNSHTTGVVHTRTFSLLKLPFELHVNHPVASVLEAKRNWDSLVPDPGWTETASQNLWETENRWLRGGLWSGGRQTGEVLVSHTYFQMKTREGDAFSTSSHDCCTSLSHDWMSVRKPRNLSSRTKDSWFWCWIIVQEKEETTFIGDTETLLLRACAPEAASSSPGPINVLWWDYLDYFGSERKFTGVEAEREQGTIGKIF